MKKILALLAVSMVLAACESGPKIRSNTAPSANLAQYKTYTFAEKLGTDRGGVETPLTGYFKEAIRREMDARGYQFVAVGGTADLMVNVGANSRENVDVRSTPAPYVGGYYGYRGGMYGGWGYGGTEVDTVRYKVGTCNIDLVDMQKRQLVWEGIAEGKLTDKAMQDPRGTISAVVTEIFKQFPGPAGAPAAGSGG